MRAHHKRMNDTRRAMGGRKTGNPIGAKGETRTRLQRAVATRRQRLQRAISPEPAGATSILGIRSPYRSGCRFIHGHPHEADSHWCAALVAGPGGSYCTFHRALCSAGLPEQRKEAA